MKLKLLVAALLFSTTTIAQEVIPPQSRTTVDIQKEPEKLVETNPSSDGYKLPVIKNEKSYKRSGLNFDRLLRTYIYQTPFIEEQSVTQNQKPLKSEFMLGNSPSDKNGKYPLIILLHAGGQTAEDVWGQTTLPEFAYANNYYLVAPDGYNRQWNDGNKNALPGEKRSPVDDVGFLMVLIENMKNNHAVDPNRVFVVGVSNGGFMATHLACRTRDLISGGVNMLSTLSYKDSRSCSQQRIPWMSINAGADKVVSFVGNIDGNASSTEELLLSAEETFSFFSNKNNCLKVSGYSQLPHFKNTDKTLGFIKVASNCNDGTKNVLLSFKNGGHVLPNTGHLPKKKPFEGLSNSDIDPGTAIINFINNNLEYKK